MVMLIFSRRCSSKRVLVNNDTITYEGKTIQLFPRDHNNERSLFYVLLLLQRLVSGFKSLSANEENTCVCTLVHRSSVLRVLRRDVRLVSKDLKANRLDNLNQVLVRGLDAVLSVAVTIMVQQRAQVDPHATGLENAGGRIQMIVTSIKSRFTHL